MRVGGFGVGARVGVTGDGVAKWIVGASVGSTKIDAGSLVSNKTPSIVPEATTVRARAIRLARAIG